MPYTIRKVPRRNCYTVRSARKNGKKYESGRKSRIFSRCTSKTKALKQVKLLRAIDNKNNFVPRKLI